MNQFMNQIMNPTMNPLWKRLGGPGIAAFLSFNLFLFYLATPPFLYFDEHHYVYAAIAMNKLGTGAINQNWSHPPLAKWIMGVFVQIAGNIPLGWRLGSAVFAALTVALIYDWAYILFRNHSLAIAASLLTVFDDMLFVFSKIALLDIFMVFFAIAALNFFTRLLLAISNVDKQKALLQWAAASGFAIGLAGVCKWSGLFFLPIGVGILFWKLRGRSKKPIFVYGLTPILSYVVGMISLIGMEHPKYAPSLGGDARYDLLSVFTLQFEMLRTQLSYLKISSPFTISLWYWPLQMHPTLFSVYSETSGQDEFWQVIACRLNLAIAVGGVFAIGHLTWMLFRRGWTNLSLLPLAFFAAWLLPWVFVARPTYEFYYFPAASLLPLAITGSCSFFERPLRVLVPLLLLTLALFIYDLPLLTAQPISRERLNAHIFNQPAAWLTPKPIPLPSE